MQLTRRGFLLSVVAGSWGLPDDLLAGSDPQTGMPMRVLGRTGQKVSILAFGGGSRFLMHKEVDQGLAALERAVALGINYIDTAQSYGNGESERRIGMFIKSRRKDVLVATKTDQRNYDGLMRAFEESLKRLQTDYVDVFHLHSLTTEEDLRAIETGGALKAMYTLRDQRVARFIGVTCHTDPKVLAMALERHDFDCVQMALNAARMGNAAPSNVPGLKDCFETIALPVARRKNLGILAMKIFGQDKLTGKAPAEDLLRYVWSLPVATAVVGMPKLELLEENARLARSFNPMPRERMEQLSAELSARYKAALDRYFSQHRDA